MRTMCVNNRRVHVFESKDDLSRGIGDYVHQTGMCI